MQHYESGPTIGPHLIRAGKLLSEQADLISITHNANYADMLKLLHTRFQARSGSQAPSKTWAFYCRVAIDHDGKRVLLDNDSWPAAKALLLLTTAYQQSTLNGKRTELIFMFAVKRKDEGLARGQRFRGLFSKGDRRATCLIEPVL